MRGIRYGRTVRRTRGTLLALFGVCAFTIGCEDDTQLSSITPVIQVDQTEIDFGTVGVGATRRVGLSIANVGTAALSVTGLGISATIDPNDVNPFFVDPADDFVLPPGGQVTLNVGFTPAVNEIVSGTLFLSSDDPGNPQVSVALQGQGDAGQVTVQPPDLDLTATTVGRTVTREIVVRNLGIEPLQDAQLVAEGFARPEHFTLTGLPRFDQPAAFALDARLRQVLLLTYTPQALGDDDGLIRIETCGPRCGPEVRIRASATDAVLRITPPVVDFGGVGIGRPGSEALQVENVGTMAATIDSVEAAGNAAFSVSIPSGSLPRTLQPGENLGITATFSPTEATRAQGAVVVRTNLTSVPELQAALVGQGEGPKFVVAPPAVTFGTERGPGQYRRFVVATNAGSSDVQISSLGLTGDPELRLGATPGLPLRLGPGESVNVEVQFAPQTVGAFDGSLTIISDDPSTPMVTLPVTGVMNDTFCDLRLTPNRLLFGLMPIGHERQRRVEVTNVGNQTCRIESGAFRAPTDPEIRFVNGPALPVDLLPVTTSSPGTTRLEFEFAYQPAEIRQAKASYVLRTGDQVFPERTLSMSGQSDPYPGVFVVPEQIDFGKMPPLTCPEFVNNVTLFNSGATSIRHQQSILTSKRAGPVSPEFRLGDVPGRLEGILRGESVTYELGYRASNLGVDDAELEITLEGLPQPIVVPLRGEGADPAERTERFEQIDTKEVDVLFVIDDSCSMREEQQALAVNFAQFIRAADARAVDFHIGITTTDTTQVAGRLVGPVITRATPNFQETFRTQSAVGTRGSGIETGLEAMQGALDEADRGTGFNAGLLRPDAALVVIIVSDEDDQSVLTVTEYATDLIRRSSSEVLTAVVSGQSTGCQGASGFADPAAKYEQFLTFFPNGVSESICADWGQTLASLGGQAFGLRRVFRLAIPPSPTRGLTVEVNGSVVPPNLYRVDGRDIEFDIPPAEGATILVTYSPDC